jgi:hypothetical protein
MNISIVQQSTNSIFNYDFSNKLTCSHNKHDSRRVYYKPILLYEKS